MIYFKNFFSKISFEREIFKFENLKLIFSKLYASLVKQNHFEIFFATKLKLKIFKQYKHGITDDNDFGQQKTNQQQPQKEIVKTLIMKWATQPLVTRQNNKPYSSAVLFAVA